MTFFIDAGVIRENEGKNPLTFVGRNIIDDKIKSGDEDVWDLIAHEELKQMDVNDDSWEIHELNNTEQQA